MTLTVVYLLGAGVGIVAGFVALYDFFLGRRIDRAARLPIRIRRSVTSRQMGAGLSTLVRRLDETRFHPEVVLGIHFEGTALASWVGKRLYPVKLRTVEVHYHGRGEQHECDAVYLDQSTRQLMKGKRVAIIDNHIRTGRTLEMVSNEVKKLTSHVQTVVFHSVAKDIQTAASVANCVLFWSKRRFHLYR